MTANKMPVLPEAAWQVLREFQDARRISNPHTRQVARDIENQIKERMTIVSAPFVASGFELPRPTCLGFRNPNGITQLADMGIYGYTADQMRAMYLTALEDVRWELPVRLHGENEWTAGHNACRAATLTNLSALEQEAKK